MPVAEHQLFQPSAALTLFLATTDAVCSPRNIYVVLFLLGYIIPKRRLSLPAYRLLPAISGRLKLSIHGSEWRICLPRLHANLFMDVYRIWWVERFVITHISSRRFSYSSLESVVYEYDNLCNWFSALWGSQGPHGINMT